MDSTATQRRPALDAAVTLKMLILSFGCHAVGCSITDTNLSLNNIPLPIQSYDKLGLCVYLSDTTIRWKMYVYLLHKINYMFRPYFHWSSSG